MVLCQIVRVASLVFNLKTLSRSAQETQHVHADMVATKQGFQPLRGYNHISLPPEWLR